MADPYAAIPAFYDAEFDDARADVAFFSRHAEGTSILVLGCGTGRVCRGLESGRTVTGLDRSDAMFSRARERGGTTSYVLGDMRNFDLGAFSTVIVPNASFCFLPTRADQLACLGAVGRALAPGGLSILDLPMPDFSLLGTAHTAEKTAWQGTVDGRAVLRARESRRLPELQKLELVDRYYVDGALVAESPLHLRLVFPAEIEWMVEAAGMWVDATFGDHADGAIRPGCPRLIAIARRAAGPA
jgi:SAM-dependent methyltransferase